LAKTPFLLNIERESEMSLVENSRQIVTSSTLALDRQSALRNIRASILLAAATPGVALILGPSLLTPMAALIKGAIASLGVPGLALIACWLGLVLGAWLFFVGTEKACGGDL
jgi:hypothetical protein